MSPGKYKDIILRITPRLGILLKNEVLIGDALQNSYSNSNSITLGGAFFASASGTKTFNISSRAFEVVWMPDFRGIIFCIKEIEVSKEAIGLQLGFPISEYKFSKTVEPIAEIKLEINGNILETHCIPFEVFPTAGKVLLLCYKFRE